MEKSPDAGRPAKLTENAANQFLGRVVGENFIVEDDIFNGVSHKMLTGESPSYTPIPLAKIKARDWKLEYLDEL